MRATSGQSTTLESRDCIEEATDDALESFGPPFKPPLLALLWHRYLLVRVAELSSFSFNASDHARCGTSGAALPTAIGGTRGASKALGWGRLVPGNVVELPSASWPVLREPRPAIDGGSGAA